MRENDDRNTSKPLRRERISPPEIKSVVNITMDTLKRIQLLLDERTAVILKMTAEQPCTASEISSELDIPHSVCYRKIKQLKEADLLDETGPEDPWENKNRPRSYTSNVENAYVSLERGEMVIVLKFKNLKESEVLRLSHPVNGSK